MSFQFVRRQALLLALLAPLFALVLQLLFWTWLRPLAAILFYPAIFFSSWVGGLRGGLLGTGLSTLLMWYFFMPPERSFAIHNGQPLPSMAVFIIMGILFSLTHERRRQSKRQLVEALSALKLAHLTERQRVENSLLDTERRYRTLFEYAPDGILIADAESNYVDANTSICRMLGYTRRELIGLNAVDIVAAAEASKIDEALNQIKANPGYQREWQFRRSDDTTFKAEVMVTTMPDGNLLAMIRDITERRRAESALQIQQIHSESLLRLARGLEGALTVNDILRVTREEVASTIGFRAVWFYLFTEDRCYMRLIAAQNSTQQEVPSQDVEMLLIKGDRMLEEIAASESIVIVEDARTDPRTNKALVTKLGNRTIVNMPVFMSGKVLGALGAGTFGDEGVLVLTAAERNFLSALTHHVSVVLDRVQTMEKRQVAELALRQSESRFVKAFQANPAAMCINVVKSGRFLEVNERYCQLLGYTRDELMGRTSLELALWEDAAERSRLVESLLSHGFTRDNETRFRRKNGAALDALLSMELIDFPDESEPVLISMFFDFTDRKQAEAKISQLNEGLEQRVLQRTAQLDAANKELEAFSYSVSHDLRAPLRAMDGFSRAVQEDYGPSLPEEAQRLLQVVRASAQRMGHLIDDLLTFSRLSRLPLEKRRLEMGPLVEFALAELSAQRAGRKIELRIGLLEDCEGDPSLLKQVWINLISNALKYSQKRDTATIDVGCMLQGGNQVYFVRDNGGGFDMRYAHKLFGVFQRLHRAEDYEGTGVGLAIVQRIIHRHGGKVWAEASLNKGAAFYFTLGGEHPL